MPRRLLPAFLLLTAISAGAQEEKITFEDHIKPMLENKCFSCHNPDKKRGDLDLTSFAATLAGGAGGSVVDPGNHEASRLWTTTAKKEEPAMPPEGSPLGAAELELLTKWINGGVLETKSSVARKSDRPKVDLTVAVSAGKPEGPPPMPEHVLLEPVIVTPRTTAITALAASPWSPLLAIAGPKQILLYDTDKAVLAGVLPYEEGYAQSLRFSANGSLLILGGGRGGKFGHAVVWDVKSGRRLTEAGKEFDSVMAADISPDQKMIVIGCTNKRVKCYEVATGEELYTISKHTEWILDTAFSPDGIMLATSDRNGNVMVWEASNGGEFHILGQHKAACVQLAWRADANVLASCSTDGTIAVWEMHGGKQLKTWEAHAGGVLSVAFTPDGRLVSSGKDGIVRLWDLNGKKLAESKSQGDLVTRVAALHDNQTVVSGNWRGEVQGWNLTGFTPRATFSANPPLIAQRIVEAEKLAIELAGSLPEVEKAEAPAKQKLAEAIAKLDAVKKNLAGTEEKKAQLEKSAKDLPAQIATLAKAHQEAQAKHAAQVEALKKHAAVVEQLKQAEAALTAARQAREALTDPAQQAEQIAQADKAIAGQQAKVEPLKKAAGTAPEAIAAFDAEVKKTGDALKAAQDRKPELEKQLADATQALETLPKQVEDAGKAQAEAKAGLDRALANTKAHHARLVFYEKLPISLRAAQFNVGVLTEKEKLAQLEGDVGAYQEALKETEGKREAAVKRAAAAKETLAKAVNSLPQLQATLNKQQAEQAAHEQAMAPSREAVKAATAAVEARKKEVAAKEAAIAELAKKRDAETAAAQKVVDEQAASLESLRKKLAEVAGKLKPLQEKAAAAKTAHEQAETAANTAAAAKQQAEAAVAANQKAVTEAESALKAGEAKEDQEAAKQKWAAVQKTAATGKDTLKKAADTLNAASKKRDETQAALADADKAAAPLRGQHDSIAKEIEARGKALAEKQKVRPSIEAKYAAELKPHEQALEQFKAALQPVEADLADVQGRLAGEQKILDAKAAAAGQTKAALDAAAKQKADSEAVIAAVGKEIPALEGSLAEIKTALAEAEPQLQPQKTRVAQLEEQYLGMLPK